METQALGRDQILSGIPNTAGVSGVTLDLFTAGHDPGGRSIPVKPGIRSWADFGPLGEADPYRYTLWREWDEGGKTAMFVCMNCSSASPYKDDATVAGITRKVRSWGGYGRLVVCNTFAYRATDQMRLAEVDDPIGPDNDRHIWESAQVSDLIVFAYGKPRIKSLRHRGLEVADMLAAHDLYVLKLSQDGTPCHPLYISDETKPFLWRRGDA